MKSRDLAVKYNIKSGQVESVIREHSERSGEVYATEGSGGLAEIDDRFVEALQECEEYLSSLIPTYEDILEKSEAHIPLVQKKPVVYWLIDGGYIVYVGQSNNVISRIGQHCRDKKFDRVTITEEFGGLSFIDFEGLMIRTYNPKLNKDSWDSFEYFKRLVVYSG